MKKHLTKTIQILKPSLLFVYFNLHYHFQALQTYINHQSNCFEKTKSKMKKSKKRTKTMGQVKYGH